MSGSKEKRFINRAMNYETFENSKQKLKQNFNPKTHILNEQSEAHKKQKLKKNIKEKCKCPSQDP